MKKFLAILLVLCMGCMLLPAMAEGTDFLGDWYLIKYIMDGQEIDPSMLGMSLTMTFKEGGIGVATTVQGGEETPNDFTWELRDGALIMISEGEEATIAFEDGLMNVSVSGGGMIFSREAPASVAPAEPVAAESEEAFLGSWTAVKANMEGTIIPLDILVSTTGLNVGAELTIEAGKVTVSFLFLSDEPVVYEGASTFADGVLQMAMPEGQEPVVIQLLDSGELLCTLSDSTTGTVLPLIFTAAE